MPDTKYHDGILYCIKDSGSEKTEFFYPIIYSFAEREVGVWTDGKPLYQKTVEITNITSGTNVDFYHGISNIDIPVGCSGFAFRSDSIIKMSYMSYILPGSASGASTSVNADSFFNISAFITDRIRYSLGSTVSGLVTKIVVTLLYTKTTDTPGSGSWAQDGIPAVHYSTDEKVIGTWVDGKPIYEKSYVLDTPLLINHSNWTATTFPATSIKMFLRADGQQNGSATAPIIAAVVNGYINILFNRYNSSETYLTMFTVQYTKTTD